MSIPDNTEPILEGILLIDKPEGPTSMRAVERVRRAAGDGLEIEAAAGLAYTRWTLDRGNSCP